MESCHLCLGPLEGTKTLCQDCIRRYCVEKEKEEKNNYHNKYILCGNTIIYSNQEACKHTIKERKEVLHLLHQEQKVLTRKVKEIVENNTEQRRVSDANLAAAKLHSMRDTTLKYAQETVAKGML